MTDYNRYTSTNDAYEKHYKRWKFLLASYMGSEVYRNGEYLTRYQMETEVEYQERLSTTPLDNHCKGVISIFNSFLFRQPAYREYASLENDPSLKPFLDDADLEGRSLDAFMKDVSTYSSVFGHTWVILTKPKTNARTRAEELFQEVRPYASVLTPLSVLDWRYERSPSGYYVLSYLKYVEDMSDGELVIKEWTAEDIYTTILDDEKKEVRSSMNEVNELGLIPAICVYSNRSPIRGVGISEIGDIADLNRSIYNEYSEIEQLIRLQNHPSLVKVSTTEAGAGAGAIIQMDENMDPGLKPYLLQPSGESLESLYKSVEAKVDAIDRIAHLGAMRENKASTMSGVSRQMEFEQLNSKLSEKADNLELAEEQMWRLFAVYQGKTWDGSIDYPDSFNIQDKHSDMALLEQAARTAPADPSVKALLDFRVKMLLDDEEEFVYDDVERMKKRIEKNAEMEHAPLDANTFDAHIAEMIQQGYTMEQIVELHPEFLTVLTQRLGNAPQSTNS